MNHQRAQEIINNFPSQRILVVGDVVLDQYIRGTVERINPEAPVPILHAHRETEQSGGAGNTAKNVAALGAQAILVGLTGKDAFVESLTSAIKAEGYTAELIADDSRPTTRKIRYIASSQQMLRVDYEETHQLETTYEDALCTAIIKQAKRADGIIVSDYDKGVITKRVTETIMNCAREHNLPVAVDAKPTHAPWFVGATFISPNLKEARTFLGLDPFGHDQHDWRELATRLHEKMKAGVYMTLSADGIYVLTDKVNGEHVAQAHHVEVADTSGAGDTATAVLLLALLSGATEIEAAELANAAGAVVVGKLGAVGVTSAELLKTISSLPGE